LLIPSDGVDAWRVALGKNDTAVVNRSLADVQNGLPAWRKDQPTDMLPELYAPERDRDIRIALG
jgi:hypothetical protein